jgi:hypothetical protein
MHATLSIPGGASGVLGSPNYFNLLPGWLSNESFPLLLRADEVQANAASVTKFVPVNKPPHVRVAVRHVVSESLPKNPSANTSYAQ